MPIVRTQHGERACVILDNVTVDLCPQNRKFFVSAASFVMRFCYSVCLLSLYLCVAICIRNLRERFCAYAVRLLSSHASSFFSDASAIEHVYNITNLLLGFFSRSIDFTFHSLN